MKKIQRLSPSAPDSIKKSRSITFNVSPLLFRRIDKHCEDNNLFVAQFLRQAIEEKLNISTNPVQEPKGFWARLFG